MIDVNTIIGEPIKALNSTVIIPISKVGFGFAAGGSEFNDETVNSYNRKEKEENIKYRLPFGGGSGAGVSISPVAFLIVQNDNVKLLEATHTSVLDKLVEYIPDAVEKINCLIKRKMDKDDEYYEEEVFDGDELDKDFENDEWNEDFDQECEESKRKSKKKGSEEGSLVENEEKKTAKNEGVNKIDEINEKEFSEIIDDGKGKAKKLEEKINEIKEDSNE